MDFTEKVVLITGASSGIGAACAVQFAKFSAKVALVGRDEERLKKVAKEIEDDKGPKPAVIVADLNVEADIERIINETLDAFGHIDILINNAGVGTVACLDDSIDHYDRIMATNLRSVYLLTSHAIRHIIMSTGCIINISSVAAIKPFPDFLPYCMSMAALDMFTKCLAKEYAVDGVRVNSVNPGPVKTNFLKAAGNDNDIEAYFQDLVKISPLGKIATPVDVANIVTFLASDNAKSITGCIHYIENGLLLSPILENEN